MTETATSPRCHLFSSHSVSRQPTNPAATAVTATNTAAPTARSPAKPGSGGHTFAPMPPLLSPRSPATPRNAAQSLSTSPNYFGFQSSREHEFTLEQQQQQHSKQNWSPPSSAVRSTAAPSPSIVPLDQNPDFDAFRRQSEGKAFNLGGLGQNFSANGAPPVQQTARESRQGRTASRSSVSKERTPMEIKSQALDPAVSELSRSPKRVLSPASMILDEGARRGSPANYAPSEPDVNNRDDKADGQPRFALPLDNSYVPTGSAKPRAETLPTTSDSEAQLMTTPQHVVNLINSKLDEVLLLDLRVSTQYAKSHIRGALSLCIPTTLLKRPSFNVQKLADTFKDNRQRRKFETWRTSSHIVVYDSSSAALKDATICLNTIKKFRGEGFDGTLYIVKGGFAEFERRFPPYVERAASLAGKHSPEMNVDADGPEVAPVVGGCPMPETENAANPFFGNIRQNMDLIGGVGQIPLSHPAKATRSAEQEFPEWLRTAADVKDEGKRVAQKFEQIERREKKRMEDALSGKVSYGSPTSGPQKGVQIAGLEKGNKNRYNNIWPFEHSRVRLQDVPALGCDYFNANYISTSRSNKRYISTQAPIPGTFNDFWNVIWQQDVRVIVMLTAEKEGAQLKAHNYWESKHYGSLHLDLHSQKRATIEPARIRRHRQRPSVLGRSSTTSTKSSDSSASSTDNRQPKLSTEEPYVTVRRFTLSHDKYPFEPMREITQLQYSNWPDFGAPAHPAHVLGLVEQTNAVTNAASKAQSSSWPSPSSSSSASSAPEPPDSRPILVHCSAGCGRTGTFCTVDSVVDMLKRQRGAWRDSGKDRMGSPMDVDRNDDECDLVEKTVEEFRLQRLSMVQSLRQYVLCYESVMEWLIAEREAALGKE